MLIWKFETKNFRVSVYSSPDDDVDLSWDDTGEVREKLESGEYQHFMVTAVCRHRPSGISGEDHLGGCIYADPKEFRDNVGINALRRRDGRNYGSYFSDMVHECIAECRKAVRTAQGIYIRETA